MQQTACVPYIFKNQINNIYPLKYIYTLPIMALYCCLFLLIFAKFYSKQTKITFNIRCFKTSIGNFHLIFVVYIYICPFIQDYCAVIETNFKTEKSSAKQFR